MEQRLRKPSGTGAVRGELNLLPWQGDHLAEKLGLQAAEPKLIRRSGGSVRCTSLFIQSGLPQIRAPATRP
jgi:hypothetical protein